MGSTEQTGTRCRFKPSEETFTNIEFSYDVLAKRLRELSFLNSGVGTHLKDERTGRGELFKYDGGLRSFVDYLNENKTTLNPVFHFHTTREDGIGVEVALQWNDSYQNLCLPTRTTFLRVTAGPIYRVFRAALTRSLNGYIEREGLVKKRK